jgi:hypothetical protein
VEGLQVTLRRGDETGLKKRCEFQEVKEGRPMKERVLE